MNNADKLLRAFIEASGFDIESIVDTKEVPINKRSGMVVHHNLATDNQGSYKRGDDDCYYLKASMNVDYKVTKKDGIFMGNWKGTDIYISTNQEDELREMLLFLEAKR